MTLMQWYTYRYIINLDFNFLHFPTTIVSYTRYMYHSGFEEYKQVYFNLTYKREGISRKLPSVNLSSQISMLFCWEHHQYYAAVVYVLYCVLIKSKDSIQNYNT